MDAKRHKGLVVSRRSGQGVRLLLPDGQECLVSVERLGRCKVHVRVQAPREIIVLRSELAKGGCDAKESE